MVQTRYLILTALFLLVAGAGAHAQLPDGTVKISGFWPYSVRFTADDSYFMAKLDDTLRIYETATGVQAGGIPVPKVDGYAAGFLAGDSTVLVMRYNWGLYYHVWNWRKGILVDSQKVWRQVQSAVVMGNGRKMAIKVPETTDPLKQFEMWNVVGEATYLGSFLDKSYQGKPLQYDANGEYAASMVTGLGSFGTHVPVRVHIRPRLNDEIDTMHVSSQQFRVYRPSPDGSRITVSRAGGLQYVFDGTTRDSLFALDVPRKQSVIVSMDYTLDNRYLICTASPDTSIPRLEMRDGNTGQLLRIVAVDSSLDRGVVNVSPNGKFAIVYPEDISANNYILVVPLGLTPTSVQAVSGIESASVIASPNPARHVFSVEITQQHSGCALLRLVRSDGAEVYSKQFGHREPGRYKSTMSVEGLPSGTYLLVVEESCARSIVPIIVEH